MSKILIVDDAPMIEGFMQEALKMGGHEVVGVARNGREAVALYEKLRPDLMTLDINMPEMDGEEALAAVLSIDPSARVLIITAMNQPILRKHLMDRGAREVLGKPVRLEDLYGAIQTSLLDASTRP